MNFPETLDNNHSSDLSLSTEIGGYLRTHLKF